MKLRALFFLFAFALTGLVLRAQMLDITSNLGGAVRSVDGQPLAGVRVELLDRETSRPIASAYTFPNGSFELYNIPRGHYELVATLGLDQTRQRIDMQVSDNTLVLRLPNRVADSGSANQPGRATVSVAELKVPKKAVQAYRKAEEALHNTNIQEAWKRVEQSLQIEPGYAPALTLRGILKMDENRAEEAREDLERAVRQDYGYAMGYLVLGGVYNRLSRFDDALRVLPQGLTLSPNAWQGYFEMARALLGKGDYASAIRQATKALQLEPDKFPPIHLLLANSYLGLKDYRQAVGEFEAYLGNEPNGRNSGEARKAMDEARAFLASSGR